MQTILMNEFDRLVSSIRIHNLDLNEETLEVTAADEELREQKGQPSRMEIPGTERF